MKLTLEPHKIATTSCIALFALFCITFLFAMQQWRQDWAIVNQKKTVTVQQKPSNQDNLIASLPSEHLFGKSFAKIGDVPLTNLQFMITGIAKTNQEGKGVSSKVYISMGGQPSKIYQVGDILPYGVKVYTITPDAVILENDGRLEKLPLPREKLVFKTLEQEKINV